MNIKIKIFSLFVLLLISSLILSSCSLTGNVIKDQNNIICENGNSVKKVIKGKLINFCCIDSDIDNRVIETCNSKDSKYREVTVLEDSMIVSRKIIFPLNGMSCSETYGRLSPNGNLELIKDLSVCIKK